MVKLDRTVYAAGFVGTRCRWSLSFTLPRAALASVALALLALLAVIAPSFARAAEPQVAVSIDPCVPVDRAQLERLLAIELGTSTAHGGGARAPTRVWVTCTERGIELRLEDAVTRKSMTRSLPASSFTNAQSTRLLALAIAEFVVASWIELSVQPAHAIEPIGPDLPQTARSNAERVVQERRIAAGETRYDDSLSAALIAQVWSRNDSVVLGGGLRWWQTLSESIAWAASGELGVGAADASFGTVHVTLASLALAAGWRLQSGRFALYTGPGGRIGYAYVAGDPRDATQAKGKRRAAAYGGLIWLSRVEYRSGQRLRLALELEGGVTTLPFTGLTSGSAASPRDRQTFALDGFWLTTGLAIGVGF